MSAGSTGSGSRENPDPFHSTADPAAYVRRDSCEAALNELCAGLGAGNQLFVLHGPAGFGKTLALRMLPSRLHDAARMVYVPYGALEPADLCAIVVAELRASEPERAEPVASQTPEEALVEHARRLYEDGTPLVVAVDDASALAPESVRRLVQLARQSDGALRWIVVPIDDARAGRVVAALGLDVVDVRLRAPLTAIESESMLEACLERAGASTTLRERFDLRAIERLHHAAGGSPRRLLMLASHFARGDEDALEALAADAAFDEMAVADPEAGAVPSLETDEQQSLGGPALELDPPELEVDDEVEEDEAVPPKKQSQASEPQQAPSVPEPAPEAALPREQAPPAGPDTAPRAIAGAGLLLASILFGIGIWLRLSGS